MVAGREAQAAWWSARQQTRGMLDGETFGMISEAEEGMRVLRGNEREGAGVYIYEVDGFHCFCGAAQSARRMWVIGVSQADVNHQRFQAHLIRGTFGTHPLSWRRDD